jgi:nucleoid DNA-binding protein
MKNIIEHYISQLLYTNDCVILIGFGGFVCSNTSSKLNKQTGLLSPPNRSILFNNQLIDNDGLLINHIAKSEKISQEQAKSELIRFVDKNKNDLNKYKSLRLKKIGLFTLNNNQIIFSQDLTFNYNLDSYGMQSNIQKMVARSTIETIEDSLKIIKPKTNFTTKRLLKVAAILIPLIGLSLISITQQKNIENIYVQMANLNPFSMETENIDLEKNKIVATLNPLENIISDTHDKNIKDKIIIRKTHYIIAGAFSVEDNAQKLMIRLNKWNYNSTIISNENIMRVSYNSFTTKDQALTSLKNIRKENPDAWILSL